MRNDDRDKFVRLANKRVNNVIKSIQLIGNLSNRSNYSYHPDDVQKIFKALQEELAACKRKFDLAQKKGTAGTQFNLE